MIVSHTYGMGVGLTCNGRATLINSCLILFMLPSVHKRPNNFRDIFMKKSQRENDYSDITYELPI